MLKKIIFAAVFLLVLATQIKADDGMVIIEPGTSFVVLCEDGQFPAVQYMRVGGAMVTCPATPGSRAETRP